MSRDLFSHFITFGQMNKIGLTVSNNLTWNTHIGEVIKKQTNARTF